MAPPAQICDIRDFLFIESKESQTFFSSLFLFCTKFYSSVKTIGEFIFVQFHADDAEKRQFYAFKNIPFSSFSKKTSFRRLDLDSG